MPSPEEALVEVGIDNDDDDDNDNDDDGNAVPSEVKRAAASFITTEAAGEIDGADGVSVEAPATPTKDEANTAEVDSPPAKRARTDGADDDANDDQDGAPNLDVQQAVLKFKRKKGTAYHITFGEDEPSNKGAERPFGIKLNTVRLKQVHTHLSHYYESALGEKYRGRPPMASDQAVIVEHVSDKASGTTQESVQRNDFLLLINDKLVNITDKKRLKYFKARLNNAARPLKLTFWRPLEGEEEELDDEEDDMMELDPSEALYVSQYEPPESPKPPSNKKAKLTVSDSTKEDRSARRALLERRLEDLEILHAETATELSELRSRDGILEGDANTLDLNDEEKLKIKGDEDFVIPPHIMYYPPMKLRRKKLPSLNEACKRVENLLRQRMMIDKEADKIRDMVKQAQGRLGLKDKELAALDKKMAPALEEVKIIEMEVQDNWKTVYLKLKEYYDENGHSNVMEKEDTKLSKWVTRQRTCYANAQLEEPNSSMGIIKPYQYELLNRIDFSWNPRETQFCQNVTILKAYRAEHGHTNVPMKYHNIHLANFVQKWRREYRLFQEGKPSNMSQDRLQVLEEAGFTWRDPSRTRKRSDTRQETWDGFLSQLQDFYVKYGHFMVNKVNKTLEKGNRLGRLDEFCGWVRKQYSLYKVGAPCQLTDGKVQQLKDMGFWLERGQANKYSQAAKKQEEEDQLGQLFVPKIEGVNSPVKEEV